MKVILDVPEDLVEAYRLLAEGDSRATPEGAMVFQLNRFKALRLAERYLLVSGEERVALEAATGGLPLVDADSLVARVDKIAALRFGEVRVAWAPKTFATLQARATKFGLPIDRYVKKLLDEILPRLLDTWPRAEVTVTHQPLEQVDAAQAKASEPRGAAAVIRSPRPAQTQVSKERC